MAVGILLFGGVFAAKSRARGTPTRIRVVFRFDDVSANSCTQIEDQLVDAFRIQRMRLTLGVIPFKIATDWYDARPQQTIPLPQERVNTLRQAVKEGTIEIAQHGYSHQTNGVWERNHKRPSEFAGSKYEKQLEKIEEGKKFLEEKFGVRVRTFVPPWNSYDGETITAVEQAGFEVLSADTIGPTDVGSRLRFAPATCTIQRLKEAIELARDRGYRAPIIVVVFHEFDFKEVNAQRGVMTYRDFTQLLDWISEQEAVEVKSVDELERISAREYARHRRFLTIPRVIPRRLEKSRCGWVLVTRKPRRTYYATVFAFHGTILLLCSGLGFAAGVIVFPKVAKWSRFLLFIGALLLVAGTVYTFGDGQVGLKGVVACVGLSGAWIGALASRLLCRRASLSLMVETEATTGGETSPHE